MTRCLRFLIMCWKARCINTSRALLELSMIKCVVCKAEKPDDEFNWRNRQTQTRKNNCKLCDRAMKKRYYEIHREKVISDNVARAKGKRARFREWKSTLSCCLCGESEEACLDFHHKDPAQKDQSVATLFNMASFEAIVSELNKCICVCANCHRKIHKYSLDVSHIAGIVFNG